MPLSKEELEQAIKSDEKSLRNFSERMRELRERAKESMNEENPRPTGPRESSRAGLEDESQ